MVDIKTAVENAIRFARNSPGPERTLKVRLEEIESTILDGRPVWMITLSSLSSDQPALDPLQFAAAGLGADTTREYKVFAVAKDDGEVLSMKIRLLATSTM